MDKDKLVRLMGEIPFFKDMNQADRESLLTCTNHWLQFKSGEKILEEDEIDYGFFVLLEGKVSVVRSKPAAVSLAQLVPGSIFGEITLKSVRSCLRSSFLRGDPDARIHWLWSLMRT